MIVCRFRRIYYSGVKVPTRDASVKTGQNQYAGGVGGAGKEKRDMTHAGIIPVHGRSAKGESSRAAAADFSLSAAVVFFLLSLVALAGWPVDGLELRPLPADRTAALPRPVFAALQPLGLGFETRYIHSLQLSPVEDSYRVQEGRIWAWRERVLSHNAGLPSLTPPRGRFIMDPPWMIVEGGGQSWTEIIVRVGNETFGKNEFRPAGQSWIALWQQFSGQRLLFQAVRRPLFEFF